MGLFDSIFRRPSITAVNKANGYFKTLTAYQPVFNSWSGQLYESELVRSAIDARARHISKLKVEAIGSAKPNLQRYLRTAPNSFQTWGQFLYRLSTILDMQNTAFIVPVLDDFGNLTGYFPVLPSKCELVEYNGEPWIRYEFQNGSKAAIEFSRCGILTKFQYKDDFFGEKNTALNDTMGLIDIQRQGIQEGVKSAATYRFMAKITNFTKPDDLRKERERFTAENLSSEGGGMLLFPNTYSDIQQIKNTAYTVDNEQMKRIETNVYNYFGVNEKILQNSAIGDDLDAFFEGAIEPFAIQLSDVLTKMTFTSREQTSNSIAVTANRLMYMSISNKINLAQQLGDRGMIMIDEIRELFNYPPLPDGKGQHLPIRGEFYMADEGKNKENSMEDDND